MKWLIASPGAYVLLCWSSTGSLSADLSGVWKINTQGGPISVCTLVQTGRNLIGSCVGPQAKGHVIGTVAGAAAKWRWEWVTQAGIPGSFTFTGAVQSDNSISGVMERGTFTATRQQSEIASASIGGPAAAAFQRLRQPEKSAIELDYEEISRIAYRMYPWASQDVQRNKFITEEMRAAADRRQGHSYSIRVAH